ncbi:MAG TPA: Ig-like domain-containing protein [Caulobacteraceae bacterium]|nr:Ig-like domain-containing protein [Caulobacteraceae bacterium]
MRTKPMILVAAMAAALAGQAVAAESSDFTAAPDAATQGLAQEVQGLTITPARGCPKPRSPADPEVPAPKLVSTFPAEGATVKPGVFFLRLTFDLPMACPARIARDHPLPNPCPGPLVSSMISRDRRTFLATCWVSPNVHYGVKLAATSIAGHALEPRELRFSTSDAKAVRTADEAIAEDPVLQAMVRPPADASRQPATAEPSDSTLVQGLVIRGRLSTVVQGLVVTPSRVCLKPHKPPDPDVPAPKLISSFPANGAKVKPGIIIVRLTFDLPMACSALIDGPVLTDNPCPAPLVDPVISRDRRTFMTVCAVQPNSHYGIWLDGPSSPPPRWTDLAGHELASRQINFTTSGGAKVSAIKDAIAEDPVLKAMIDQGSDDAASPPPAGADGPSGR